jgi:hypothetical protein
LFPPSKDQPSDLPRKHRAGTPVEVVATVLSETPVASSFSLVRARKAARPVALTHEALAKVPSQVSAEQADADAGEDAVGLDGAAGLVEAWYVEGWRAAAVAVAVHSVRIGVAVVVGPCWGWHWDDTSRDWECMRIHSVEEAVEFHDVAAGPDSNSRVEDGFLTKVSKRFEVAECHVAGQRVFHWKWAGKRTVRD